MKQKKTLLIFKKITLELYEIKKGSKLHAIGNNQIWNNKKQLLFVCMIIEDNIEFEIFLKR